MRLRYWLTIACLLWPSLALPGGAGIGAEGQAQSILKTAGVKGGLLVHLGCGDGKLTAALRAGDSWLVHGLDRQAANVEKARAHIRGLGLYGKVSVDVWKGGRLPYADNVVNLLVAEDLGGVGTEEVMRVLSPGGALCTKKNGAWTRTEKPRPAELDEWTHVLHGPDNNAVSRDTVVAPPQHMQWVGGPVRARSHELTASISAAVSAGGRVFYVADEGPIACAGAPPKWSLFARDAFSGVLLWKRPIAVWQGHLGGFHDGLADLSRRVVAAGDTVYASLGIGEPLTALDAATGETVKVYEGTAGAREFIRHGKALYVIAGDVEDQKRIARGHYSNVKIIPRDLVALDAESGRKLWAVVDKTVPCTLTASGKRLFYQNPKEVVCLDAASGQKLWAAPRESASDRVAGDATPTILVSGEVLLTAEGSWRGGTIVALSVEDGKELWNGKTKQPLSNQVDVFVIDGKVWTGMWSSHKNAFPAPRDLATGSAGELPNGGVKFLGDQPSGHHHRCYRNKATSRFLLTARRGVEFVDVTTGRGYAYNGFRGTCQYGVMPANGLLYLPPNSCACYIQANPTGFKAMAGEWKPFPEDGDRLQKGPAYGQVPGSGLRVPGADEWPTHRGDASRSGLARRKLPAAAQRVWTAELGGRLSPPTVAGGRVYVASVEDHTVHALDQKTGNLLWSFTTGGRVDSPPTISGDAVLFGSRDGHVYCLSAKDGKLAWRFRAAPLDIRMVAWDGVESVWPVHGSVLVTPGGNGAGPTVWAAAGRSSFLSGGVRVCRLALATGQLVSETRIDTTGTRPGGNGNGKATGGGFPQACIPDVLSFDGKNVFMGHVRMDAAGKRQVEKRSDPGVSHVFCAVGFLDDTWWQRCYWVYGSKASLEHGLGTWAKEGWRRPFGRILTVDGETVYGFGRDDLGGGYSGGHVGFGSKGRRAPEYRLFAADAAGAGNVNMNGRKAPRDTSQAILWKPTWARSVPLLARAMLLGEGEIVIAGPPAGDIKDLADALAGKQGGILLAASRADGKTLGEVKLESAPVFDGMAAAGGRLYVSCIDGKVRCFGGQ
jgi:outer membrane protein assembly factor BamB